ncbi:MAG TPA: cell surface protein SprA, partial [Chitinophagales bacterium]|nr:cell surface protein SprA [Chitinophagales bacterium]
MRGTKKIFSWVAAAVGISILYAAYAGTGKLPFLPPVPVPMDPVAPTGPTGPTGATGSTGSTGSTGPVQLKYPMKDRQGDFVTGQQQDPFYLKDPPAVQESVDYDPATGMYVVTEKVGGQDVRPPMYMTYDDYLKYTEKQEMDAYWKERANAVNLVEEKSIVPPIQVKKQFFDRLFGGSKIEIKPQGNVEMTLGANIQKTANPNIPIRNRQTGGFDFDMNINMNVVGKIGDKLQLGVKYNTQSGFQFDNQVKLGYTGDQDDIIRSIEAGNVSLPLPTRLITGSQTLFGVKTVLQFGRLTWTSVISQQQSKKQTVTLENGAQQQTFSINSDQYEENRNFFLAQYFYDHYDEAMAHLPNIKSVVNITRIEVWVTNRNGVTQNVRNVVGLMDLGENQPYETNAVHAVGTDGRPRNEANNLYSEVISSPSNRLLNNAVSSLQSYGLQQGEDFEQTYARKLNPSEFTYNAQLGYISLNTQLNPNDVLAVAYQYTYNGQTFKVGEFGDDVPPDSNSTSKVIYLKLLKGTAPHVNLPIWKLMMKNIYSLGAFGISNQNFYLDIYYNDPGGGLKRYIPTGCLKGKPLLSVMGLDNLDLNNNQQPDGLFDFISGITILPQTGKLIFPVVQPFGNHLTQAFVSCGTPADSATYDYKQLYDSTRFNAQQFPEYNRFVIKGTYRGTSGNQISLGAGNIPRGSVVVTAGGQKLTEGTDYTVDYNLGRVTILNQSIINSGQQIKVDYENNNQFATQTQSMYGTRLDYKISSKFNIGATLMTLAERPFTQKVNIGDDPIRNTIMGTDIRYETNLPWLTKAISKLYPTKEMSTIQTYGEMAYLKPGHSKAINDQNKQGQVYIDDFEGTSSGYDLKTPSVSWHLASTPRGSTNAAGQAMFPEGDLINDERYGYNRAKIAWYRIDNSFFNQQTAPSVVYNDPAEWQNHYTRLVPYQEVFPNAPNQTIDQNLYTFDVAFYPRERGPYNYEATANGSPGISHGIYPDGSLKDPQTRWGGIMRSIDNSDLVATNVEYIEFWLLDPFIYNKHNSGHLYIDLGYISEDILRDSRASFENGLSSDSSTLDATYWGEVPKLVPLVNAFDNDQNLRPVQDVGIDGLSDAQERTRKSQFLATVAGVVNSAELAKLTADPSSDDYVYFQDNNVYSNEPSILNRYKDYCGTEGNSPIQTNSIATTAETNLPDKEDINNDNTLNQDEAYFQYDIPLTQGMDVGNNPYIVSTVAGTGVDNQSIPNRWLQFRIPINGYTSKVGNISDFTSIQFMRMFLTGFDTAVILRFGTLQLTRNQWRTYDLSLDDACEGTSPHGGERAFFNVGSVGLEANGSKTPVNYVLPPNIERQQALGAQTNQFVAQDEQSLALSVCDLKDCGRKAVFKNLNLDLRNYKRLDMYIHANRIDGEPTVADKQVTAFIRIGSDFVDNYYEYEIPLFITPDGVYSNDNTGDRQIVWPDSNSMEITLQDFISLKEKRNATTGFPINIPYTTTDALGHLITIKGNPDIGAVKTIMLGIHNPGKTDPNNPLKDADDGQAKCVEVWFDELRVNGFDTKGGVAALATVNIKLADLGNIGLAGSMHTAGFGQVDQKIDQRYKDNLYTYNFTANLEVGKFIPQDVGVRIPFYANYAQSISTPQYDPYQFDIKSKEMIDIVRKAYGNDSARKYAQEIRTINTNRGFNFTNVRIVPKTKAKRPHIYDPGNFNFTYAYNEIAFSDPFTLVNSRKNWLGIIA